MSYVCVCVVCAVCACLNFNTLALTDALVSARDNGKTAAALERRISVEAHILLGHLSPPQI